MWSEPIGAVFALLGLRISDRNMLRRERFVSAHSSREIAVHPAGEMKVADLHVHGSGSMKHKEFRPWWTRK